MASLTDQILTVVIVQPSATHRHAVTASHEHASPTPTAMNINALSADGTSNIHTYTLETLTTDARAAEEVPWLSNENT